MPYLAKSISGVQHQAQHKVQRKALKALKRSKLAERIEDISHDLTPYVAAETGLDTGAAKKQARRWIIEAIAEKVAMGTYELVFISEGVQP